MSKAVTDKELSSVIGEELLQKCKHKFSGRQCYFPKKYTPLKFNNTKEKAEFIYNAVIKSGMSFEELGLKMNLSTDYVKKLYYKHTNHRGKL